MRHDTLARALLFLLVAVVLYLTLTPNPPHVVIDTWPYGDKIEHCLAFGSLAVMARLSFPRAPTWQVLEHLSFLGALIEVAQATPGLGRDCDWHDWLADTVGAGLGLVVAGALLGWLLRARPDAPPVTLH